MLTKLTHVNIFKKMIDILIRSLIDLALLIDKNNSQAIKKMDMEFIKKQNKLIEDIMY